jgi:hypothetical protein
MAVVADAGEPLSPRAADLVRRIARMVLDEPADLMGQVQAARARQAATASTATPREKLALLPGRTPLREQLPSWFGAPPRLVFVIPEPSDLTWPHDLALHGSFHQSGGL